MVIWDSLRQWWYSTIFDNSLRTNTIYGVCTLLSSCCFIDYSRYCFRKDRRGKRDKSSPPCCLLGCSCHVSHKLCWIPLWGKCRVIFLEMTKFIALIIALSLSAITVLSDYFVKKASLESTIWNKWLALGAVIY